MSVNKFSPGQKARIILAELDNISEDNLFIKVSVYSLKGILIKELINDTVDSSEMQQLSWDGTDTSDEYAASGLYIIKIQLNSIEKVRKVFFIK